MAAVLLVLIASVVVVPVSPVGAVVDSAGGVTGGMGVSGLVADAGSDQSVVEGSTVTLDGSGSSKDAVSVSSVGPLFVDGKSNIFGAGRSVPPGPAPGVLPVDAGLSLTPGRAVTFSGASGLTNAYGCHGIESPPDGVDYQNTNISSLDGISGIVDSNRQQFLVGVFLGPDAPSDPAPPRLDFSTDHDFVSLSPLLAQTFFIGDGLTGSGATQSFVVPAGATRLYLGLADGWSFHGAPGYYDDNCGGYDVSVHAQGSTIPVSYRWDVVDSAGPPVRLSSSTSATPSFQTFDDGLYTFRLTASAGGVSDSDEVTVRVANAPPVVTRVGVDPTATDGLAEVAVSVTDPGVFDSHTLDIDWGDGSDSNGVPVSVAGTGWGYGVAGHVYAMNGSFTVSVVARDGDGGVSAAKTQVVDVGGAGAGAAMPGASVWAEGTGDKAVWVSGSGNSFDGLVHSDGGIKVTGSHHNFTGGTEYASEMNVAGSSTTVDPPAAQVAAGPFPYVFDAADYQPGGVAALAAGSSYHPIDPQDCTGSGWRPDQPLESGGSPPV